MKHLLFFLFLAAISLNAFSQQVTGQWNGILKVQGMQLRVVFHVTKSEDGFAATMDSPDQNAKGIPVTTTSFVDSTLTLTVSNAGIVYEGVVKSDSLIVGNFKQGGQSFPMNLSRVEQEKEKLTRPQEPKKPYPYYSEEVTFFNSNDEIKLAGTLTLPKKEGKFPAVVLISGSGAQNRDEELMGHKPFLVLSDYLTRQGIAVLRFDDRGTASSGGVFGPATTQDFSTDVEAAVKFLMTRNEIDKKKIGLVGHSEGGLIAPMVASRSKDIAFIVLLAGTGIRGDELLLLQQQLIGRASGMSDSDLKTMQDFNKGAFDVIVNSKDQFELEPELTTYMKDHLGDLPATMKPAGVAVDELAKLHTRRFLGSWMQYFLKYDPVPALLKVTCPVLAINGAKDLQVPAKENLAAIESALRKGGNKNVTTKELPNLNHLFQECTTGSPAEYSTIEQTFSPIALQEIAFWIQAQVK